MTGRVRTQLLEYITAVERGVYRLPANTPRSLPTRPRRWRRCTRPGTGTRICRMTWPRSPSPTMRRTGRPRRLRGRGQPRTSYVSRSQRELAYGPGEPALLAVGEVRMVEEEMNPYVIS